MAKENNSEREKAAIEAAKRSFEEALRSMSSGKAPIRREKEGDLGKRENPEAGGNVINPDFEKTEKAKKAEKEPEKDTVPEQEKPVSFFEEAPDGVEEGLAEKRKEKELKEELKGALKKLHRAVDTRRKRNKKLEGESLAREQRTLAEQLMAKGEVKETLVNWFQKKLGNEPKTIMFELIKDSWANEEEVTAYYVRIGQEKSMWLKRRLEEMMEGEKEMPMTA